MVIAVIDIYIIRLQSTLQFECAHSNRNRLNKFFFFSWGTNDNALEMEGRTGGVTKNDELETITSRERIID